MPSRQVSLMIGVLTITPVVHAQQTQPPPSQSTDTQPGTEEKATPAPLPPELPALPADAQLLESSSAPPASAAFESPTGDISIEEWSRDDWMLLKPSVNLIELNGYFRVRGDMFRRLDFDNGNGWERPLGSGEGTDPRYDKSLVGEANYVSTNMRLRLEPTINVTDRIQIITTVDVLDNLILGSTPDTLPSSSKTPVNVLSRTQQAPSDTLNALTDSIVVKRAYARLTALNEQLELRVGRMPNHWGLGMMTNDGDCLDCDYGDVTDRIALTFRAANHLFAPMFDWVSSGPIITPFGRSGGQPIDAIDRDDVVQYSLRIERLDHPKDIRDRLAQGEMVVNYGVWNVIRTQDSDIDAGFYEDSTDSPSEEYDPAASLSRDLIYKSDAFLYTVDAYGKVMWGDFELSLEGAFVWGSFKDKLLNSSEESGTQKTQVYKIGAALEGAWNMPSQRPGSRVTFKAGGASGDSMAGFGTLDRSDTQRGQVGGQTDRELNNFQFSPDYHIDLLMFRRIIGTVSDAWYVRPGVTYMFDDRFAGSLAAIYSQAIFKRSTAGKARPMGLELDAELSYGIASSATPSPFGAAIMGGIAFPFTAFDNLELSEEGDQGGSFAWTLQARIYLTF